MADSMFVNDGGAIKSNKGTDTLVNNTLLEVDITVPTGVQWFYQGGMAYNADNVARNVRVVIMEGANVVLIPFPSTSVGATSYQPIPAAGSMPKIPLLAGWIIRFTFYAGGASAGGTCQVSAVVKEVPA